MTLCSFPVGSKPWWMGTDQWDGPCKCILELGHDGKHACTHGIGD